MEVPLWGGWMFGRCFDGWVRYSMKASDDDDVVLQWFSVSAF